VWPPQSVSRTAQRNARAPQRTEGRSGAEGVRIPAGMRSHTQVTTPHACNPIEPRTTQRGNSTPKPPIDHTRAAQHRIRSTRRTTTRNRAATTRRHQGKAHPRAAKPGGKGSHPRRKRWKRDPTPTLNRLDLRRTRKIRPTVTKSRDRLGAARRRRYDPRLSEARIPRSARKPGSETAKL